MLSTNSFINTRLNSDALSAKWLQWPTHDNLKAANWGRAHPDFGKDAKKLKWSDSEIRYVVGWCENAVRLNPESKKTVISKCLKAIYNDPEAIMIFHKHHVLNSGRLRGGYRTAMKKGLFSQSYLEVDE